ncbi:hypothetical protein LZ31DRAFT_585772 [Colletotrichum somersetense]|nr:hypothetical protein LZ31DRAFT_585772 [Colletotrichum somersetense]
METTTQAWKRVVLDDPEPAEPSQIILIPDWHAECKLGPSNEPDECKTSTLVLEYKDRGLTFVDEFIAECKKSDERLDDIADQITDMEQLDREMDRGEGQSRYNFRRLVRNHRHDYVPNLNSNGSTLGLKEPCSFSKNVETVLRQTSTYALADGAPYLGLTDYQTLVMLEYVDLKKKMLENEELRTDDIARLRAGPGIRVDVVPIKDDENQSQIRRVMLGAWLQAIRGL